MVRFVGANRHKISIHEDDSRIWDDCSLGLFTVSSAYDVITEGPLENISNVHKQLWKLNLPLNITMFVWRAIRGRLATKDNMRKRRVQLSSPTYTCVFCDGCKESLDHLLLHCPFADKVWDKVHQWLGVQHANQRELCQKILGLGNVGLVGLGRSVMQEIWCAVCWAMWNHRNAYNF